MNQKEKNILDGLILSDGCLRNTGKSAYISFSLKYRMFAESIIDAIPSLNWAPIRTYKYFDSRTSKEYTQISFRSRNHPYLTEQHIRWYPKRKKIIPKDLCLSSDTLLWWYLGDGCLIRKKARPNYRRVILSTNSFTNKERKYLIYLLVKLLGTKTSINSEGNKIIYIGRDALCKMASMFRKGSSVSCYDYKFEFGQYLNSDYLKRSYEDRPLANINDYRKKHKVREFDLSLLKEAK